MTSSDDTAHARRADRFTHTMDSYDADCDVRTSFTNCLTDAHHWCRVNGHSFDDLCEIALLRYDAECNPRRRP